MLKPVCNSKKRVSEAAAGNSTVTVGVQLSPQLQERCSGVHCHSGELPLSRCQEASPDSTGIKKPPKANKNPLTFHPPAPKLYVSNLQKFLQSGKQAGALGGPWVWLCRDTRTQQAPQPVLPQRRAHQDLFWKSLMQTRGSACLGTSALGCQCQLSQAPHLLELLEPALRGMRSMSKASSPGGLHTPGRDEDWWLCTPQPDLLRAPGSVQPTQSCPGLSWKG